MTLLPIHSPRALGALQRVLLVALLTPAVLLALLPMLPALLILPFLHDGTERTVKLLRAHTDYLRTLLTGSNPSPEPPPPVTRPTGGELTCQNTTDGTTV